MKIFVTGGTGFIGTHVLNKLLSQNHSVLLLSRTLNKSTNHNLQIINGNLSNIEEWKNELQKFKPDSCIHLGWEGLPDHSYEISKLNLEYGLNLIVLLSKIGCKRLLIIGSCFEYGVQKGKLSEKTLPKSLDSFTASKHSLHWLGEEIAKQNDMDFIWIRPFFVYGPGQHSKSLIPYILNTLKAGNLPVIRNPEAKNDFVYVEDVADAICKILKKGTNGETYNVGSGKLTSIKQIINYTYKNLKIKNNFQLGEKILKDAISSSYADISKIKKEIGWEPRTNIKEGIEKTIKYSQNN